MCSISRRRQLFVILRSRKIRPECLENDPKFFIVDERKHMRATLAEPIMPYAVDASRQITRRIISRSVMAFGSKKGRTCRHQSNGTQSDKQGLHTSDEDCDKVVSLSPFLGLKAVRAQGVVVQRSALLPAAQSQPAATRQLSLQFHVAHSSGRVNPACHPTS